MRFQFEPTESASEVVIRSVAEAEGVDPVELTPSLYEAIDPDALDELFKSALEESRPDLELTFLYSGYQITLQGNGHGHLEKTG